MKTTVDNCRIVNLPKISARQYNITYVEGCKDTPFDIGRVYYLYDIPGGETRGGHAHKELEQLVISIRGFFDIVLDDGRKRKTVTLDRPYYGLYIPKLIWRELVNFSSEAICLVLASLPYDESDYVRDYNKFLRIKRL